MNAPSASAALTARTALDQQRTPSLEKTSNPEEARKSAEEFEAFFIAQVLDQMFKGIKTDEPFGGGHGEEMFRGLMHQEYGKSIAKQGGIGIADAVMRELLSHQEVEAQ